MWKVSEVLGLRHGSSSDLLCDYMSIAWPLWAHFLPMQSYRELYANSLASLSLCPYLYSGTENWNIKAGLGRGHIMCDQRMVGERVWECFRGQVSPSCDCPWQYCT